MLTMQENAFCRKRNDLGPSEKNYLRLSTPSPQKGEQASINISRFERCDVKLFKAMATIPGQKLDVYER